MLIDWPRAFGLTVLVELPIYTFLLRRWCRPAAAAGLGLLANAITHPALWFGLTGVRTGPWEWAGLFLSAETAVWLVEWSVLLIFLERRGDRGRRAELAAVAALANVASAAVGLLLALI